MRRTLSLAAFISVLLALPAFAEGPTSPPPLEGRMGDFPPTVRQKTIEIPPSIYPIGPSTLGRFTFTEKAAYLGITTSPVTATLREQLSLPKGFGLVVDFVEKDSPADKAGLKVHDILQKLDDQLLINAPQLTVLVRSKKKGDAITLTGLRAAKPLTLQAKLVEKDLPILDENPHAPQWLTPPTPPARPDGNTRPTPSSITTVISRSDDAHSITLTTTNGEKSLIVKDIKTGKLLYEGHANSQDDLKTLSPDIREKLKAMERNLAKGIHENN
ncbi:MAG: PDZ domain-containing protein [Phycisphaerales bacterium]|nr:PDZ domain-containing protein [Phycisphaerales bacterium]